jgi:hypothetical protein
MMDERPHICATPMKEKGDTNMSLASLWRQPAAFPVQIDGRALDQLFRAARTHNGWLPIDVPDALLEEAVELAKMGPTSANVSTPAHRLCP